MITRENLKELLSTLSKKELLRIKKSNKEYIALFYHCFNSGCFLTFTLTDNYNKYKNIYFNGDALLYIDNDLINIIDAL